MYILNKGRNHLYEMLLLLDEMLLLLDYMLLLLYNHVEQLNKRFCL
jgi:hypothetical protein